MIEFFNIIEALLYILIFSVAIVFSEALIEFRKTYCAPHHSKIKIVVLLIITIAMTLSVYATHCFGQVGLLECIYLNPGEEMMRNVGIALYINTCLFLGGFHQWLYVWFLAFRTEKSKENFFAFTRNSSSGIFLRNYLS